MPTTLPDSCVPAELAVPRWLEGWMAKAGQSSRASVSSESNGTSGRSRFTMWPQLSIPRFPSEAEQEFQASYYVQVRPTLRLVSGALAVTLTAYLFLGLHHSAPFVDVFSTPYLGFCLLLFALTHAPSFGKIWQGATAGLAWLASTATLFWLARIISSGNAFANPLTSGIISHLFFLLQICVLMVGLAALRLQFWPTLALQSGVAASGLGITLLVMPPDINLWNSAVRFLEPVLLVWLGVLLAAFIQEQLARGAFEANRRLAALQEQEHEKRVETEKMLHVLNGAIGGIVHDLGGPLTRVETGASLLESLLCRDDQDLATLLEVNGAVLRGAEMLNFLRLSLIEQSRVLAGRGVPVDLQPISVRAVVEAGASFQQPRFTYGHTLTFEEADFAVQCDEMKMVTVLMNLIGNALKYSQGEVRVAWHEHGDLLLLAVLDEGNSGKGLTRAQASRLFTPFERLGAHADIEGTGLGLLSARKVVEAQGGELWIEGFEDGTHDSPGFSTANGYYPSMLNHQFRTAFVLTCPLAVSTAA